jgi:hypothetical protein
MTIPNDGTDVINALTSQLDRIKADVGANRISKDKAWIETIVILVELQGLFNALLADLIEVKREEMK